MKKLLRSAADASAIPVIRRALELSGVSGAVQHRDRQAGLRREIAELREDLARRTPENPCIHGYKVFSQTDEDGIFAHIFEKLPAIERAFIEIGCGRGVENNTHNLLLNGYRGVWVDGSEANIEFIAKELGSLSFKTLKVDRQFVSLDNIAALIDRYCEFLGTTEPALFSLDIDGNDLYVMEAALKRFRPIVICAEYNPKFPPPNAISIKYNPSHTWIGDDYHGASLQAFCDLLTDYRLVACNLCGCNAFFVRNDQAGAFASYTPTQLYQPFRENLIDLRSEHLPTLRWLKDKLAD
jgi:hypothetical protein